MQIPQANFSGSLGGSIPRPQRSSVGDVAIGNAVSNLANVVQRESLREVDLIQQAKGEQYVDETSVDHFEKVMRYKEDLRKRVDANMNIKAVPGDEILTEDMSYSSALKKYTDKLSDEGVKNAPTETAVNNYNRRVKAQFDANYLDAIAYEVKTQAENITDNHLKYLEAGSTKFYDYGKRRDVNGESPINLAVVEYNSFIKSIDEKTGPGKIYSEQQAEALMQKMSKDTFNNYFRGRVALIQDPNESKQVKNNALNELTELTTSSAAFYTQNKETIDSIYTRVQKEPEIYTQEQYEQLSEMEKFIAKKDDKTGLYTITAENVDRIKKGKTGSLFSVPFTDYISAEDIANVQDFTSKYRRALSEELLKDTIEMKNQYIGMAVQGRGDPLVRNHILRNSVQLDNKNALTTTKEVLQADAAGAALSVFPTTPPSQREPNLKANLKNTLQELKVFETLDPDIRNLVDKESFLPGIQPKIEKLATVRNKALVKEQLEDSFQYQVKYFRPLQAMESIVKDDTRPSLERATSLKKLIEYNQGLQDRMETPAQAKRFISKDLGNYFAGRLQQAISSYSVSQNIQGINEFEEVLGTDNILQLFDQAEKDKANKIKNGIKLDPLLKMPLRLEDQDSKLQMLNIIANKPTIDSKFKTLYAQQEDLKEKEIQRELTDEMRNFTSALGFNANNIANRALVNEYLEAGKLYVKDKVSGGINPSGKVPSIAQAVKEYRENIIDRNFSIVGAGTRKFLVSNKYDADSIDNWLQANLGSSQNFAKFMERNNIKVPPQMNPAQFRQLVQNYYTIQSNGAAASIGYTDPLTGKFNFIQNSEGKAVEIYFSDMKDNPEAIERKRSFSDAIYDSLRKDYGKADSQGAM